MRVPSRSHGPRPTPGPCAPTDLAGYRDAVAELSTELGALADAMSGAARQRLLDERLRRPDLATVLDATPQGLVGTRETLLLELARQRPEADLSGLAGLVRGHLLSRIDAVWWADVAAFATDTAVHTSPELVDLEWLRRRGLIGFGYRQQPVSPLGRGLRAAHRGLRPHAAPRTAGLPFRRGRREIIALLNDLAREFAAGAPPGTPPLWVTDLAHSVEHQHRLRRLGAPTWRSGAHSQGYAVDLELDWFARFGARDTLAGILRARQAAGEINLIDQGSAWHVCLAPTARRRLRRAYEAEMGV
ncbi:MULTISPECIES: hypothetical protein [Micromonospora]|uniref:Uncharacterized protein n=1 Tax=Micromonospora yangpuensis TaxID=683228 RepID=A0A1C6URG9_9ACTN|nr:hypothetical protein [Micromonospora yangpuensis]GGM07221.1 hypothetical protein GCM10012279_26510 [Micromonospora yangpuensis]SCL56483.1 hypothetical protein GA0070617_3252 [Micromonospora yangpuensis]